MIHVLFVTVKLFFKLFSPHEQCNALVVHDYPGARTSITDTFPTPNKGPPYPLLDISSRTTASSILNAFPFQPSVLGPQSRNLPLQTTDPLPQNFDPFPALHSCKYLP